MTGPFGARYAMGSTFYIPFIESYQRIQLGTQAVSVSLRGDQALVCNDDIQAEIDCSFYFAIKSDVQSLNYFFDHYNGQALEHIYGPAFIKQLTLGVSELEYDALFRDPAGFRNRILQLITEQFAEIEILDILIDFIGQPQSSE